MILIAVVAVFSVLLSKMNTKPAEIALSDVVSLSQQHQIKNIEINGDTLVITKIDNSQVEAFKETNSNIYDIQGLDLTGVVVAVKSSGINWGTLLIDFLPLILFGGLILFFFRSAKGTNNQAMLFGRSQAKLFPADKPTTTFEDVAGADEAKQELHEVVEFLKNREKFQSLGARIPKGVLLVGPPGTGKTLMARAVAGEAGVPFFSISGSEFVEMFVGVGASRVRDLFDKAKRNAPCIVFIDEIDAVGRQRGAGMGGGNDEREQTLNQILVEMDGFDTNVSVIVLAATNRPDVLDPALLRPGRFDRRVVLDLPDMIGRLAVLKVHAKGKPLANITDLEVIAKATPGFSGADLANLINEAAILAARRGKKSVTALELNESIDRVIAGPERKSRRISAKEKSVTAYHEAGHALVAHLLPNSDPVHKISIIARGQAGGYTRILPQEDRNVATRSQLNAVLAVDLGGRMAEKLIFDDISTGASSDIRHATDMARKMVTVWGMSDKLGPRTFGKQEELVFLGRQISEQRDYSEKTANQIDGEVNLFLADAYDIATKILTDNKDRLIHLAQILMVKENLEGDALETAFSEPVNTPIPEVVLTPATDSATPPPSSSVPTQTPSSLPKSAPELRPLPSS
jgi:cell division protease FtsH